jgi:hypothetical protein
MKTITSEQGRAYTIKKTRITGQCCGVNYRVMRNAVRRVIAYDVGYRDERYLNAFLTEMEAESQSYDEQNDGYYPAWDSCDVSFMIRVVRSNPRVKVGIQRFGIPESKLLLRWAGIKLLRYKGGFFRPQVMPDKRKPISKVREQCKKCGKPKSHNRHIRYGNDIDNPVKHRYVPIKKRVK